MIGGSEVTRRGKEWLLLIAMRHWFSRYSNGKRLLVPQIDLFEDDIFQNTFKNLSDVSNDDIDSYINEEFK